VAQFLAAARDSSLYAPRPALGPIEPPIQWVLGLFLRGKMTVVWSWTLTSTTCWG